MRSGEEHLMKIIKNIEEIVGAIGLTIMISTAVLNVISRYIFSHPFTWGEELESISLCWGVFLSAAAAYKKNLHYGLDFVINHMPFKVKYSMRRAITVLSFILFATLFVLGCMMVSKANRSTTFFHLSYKFIYLAPTLSFLSMTIYSVIFFVKSFMDPKEYADLYINNYQTGDASLTMELNEKKKEADAK